MNEPVSGSRKSCEDVNLSARKVVGFLNNLPIRETLEIKLFQLDWL
jgi:hypothetical protein